MMLLFYGFLAGVPEKVCISWALPLDKRVMVSVCKIRKLDTHVFVPTKYKSFLELLLKA